MQQGQSTSLEDLQKKIIAFRDARDWKQFHTPKDVAISIVLEASELLEHFQWKNQKEVEKHLRENKEEISNEVADILNYLLQLAHDLDIDLLKASDRKIAHNEAKYPIEKAKGRHTKYTELT